MINYLINFTKNIIYDIFDTVMNLSNKQKIKLVETSAFGLFINSVYGLSGGINLRDTVVAFLAFYAIIRIYKGN